MAMVRSAESPREALPNYAHPPIAELVLGVQFEPLKDLLSPHIGLFWAEVRERFPNVQQQPALEPEIERFGVKQIQGAGGAFRVLDAPETPRCWFLDKTGSELIQLQQDRFIHNWRKRASSDPYPRYESIRGAFASECDRFVSFVEKQSLGPFKPNQCEVTYINHILPERMWESFGDTDRVFKVWAATNDARLPSPEDVRFSVRYVLSEGDSPRGRLHVSVQPAYMRTDESAVMALNLTARGAPEGDGLDGVLRFLDRGHRAIVLAFDALTTDAMHRVWGKQ